MRNFIDLIESAQVVLYHGSRKKFRTGTVLIPQKTGYVSGSKMDVIERDAHFRIESILEKYRPPNAIPRKDAVFMVTDPEEIDYAGGYNDNIYIVEPLGPITRCNMAWYTELYSYCWDEEIDETLVAGFAQHYWSGYPKGDSDLYEFLTSKAKIISIV